MLLVLGQCAVGCKQLGRASSERAGTRAYDEPAIAELEEIRWKWVAEAPLTTAVAVGEEHVHVADAGGTLRALTIDTGEEFWSLHLGAPAHGTPVTLSRRLLVGTDKGMVAVGYDGEVEWTFPVRKSDLPDQAAVSEHPHGAPC